MLETPPTVIQIMVTRDANQVCLTLEALSQLSLMPPVFKEGHRLIKDWFARFERLQMGMQGAFGKPQWTVAWDHISQVITSIHTKLQSKEHVVEALRGAKFEFPGHQKIHISKKWGFTKFNADELEDMVAEKRLIPDGCGVKYIPNRGLLDKWQALHS
nr:large ribosomal subunit protein uL16-like [Dasypus novemcinctus]